MVMGVCRWVREGLGGYGLGGSDELLEQLCGSGDLVGQRGLRRLLSDRLGVSRHDLVTLGDDGERFSGDLTGVHRLLGGGQLQTNGPTSGDGTASRARKGIALENDTVGFAEFNTGVGPDASAA